MNKRRVGLLVMAYGTPYKEEDIERYYTHIRHGRKPTEELLEDLKQRYQQIGGISPLAKTTKEQAEALQNYLNTNQDEVEFKYYLGLKHIEPFVEDAVCAMHEDGIEEAISIVLAPHYSTFSIKSYNSRASEKAVELGGPKIYSIDSWYDEPKFIDYWVNQINQVLTPMSNEEREKTVLIFSAHSLPEKILTLGDPYPSQLKETAEMIVEKLGRVNYAIGWQSAGNTPEPWIGPDVQDLTRDLFQEKDYTSFVYLPIGFVAEHLEVLFDNDVECKIVTEEIGANYYRPDMPNSNPEFIAAMAEIVLKKFNEK